MRTVSFILTDKIHFYILKICSRNQHQICIKFYSSAYKYQQHDSNCIPVLLRRMRGIKKKEKGRMSSYDLNWLNLQCLSTHNEMSIQRQNNSNKMNTRLTSYSAMNKNKSSKINKAWTQPSESWSNEFFFPCNLNTTRILYCDKFETTDIDSPSSSVPDNLLCFILSS